MPIKRSDTVFINGNPVAYYAPGEMWPQYRYSEKSTNYATGSTPATGSGDVAVLTLSQEVQPAVGPQGAGYAYTYGGNELLTRFTLPEQSTDWTVAVGSEGNSPAYYDGQIIFHNGYTLYGFDSETGDELWSSSADAGGWVNEVLVVDNVAVLGTDSGLAAYDLDNNGSKLWTAGENGDISDKPASDGTSVYWVDGTDLLMKTALSDGTTSQLGSATATMQPAYHNGSIIAINESTSPPEIMSVSTDGTVDWATDIEHSTIIDGNFVVHEQTGTVAVQSYDNNNDTGSIQLLNLSDGTQSDIIGGGTEPDAPMIGAGNYIYVMGGGAVAGQTIDEGGNLSFDWSWDSGADAVADCIVVNGTLYTQALSSAI